MYTDNALANVAVDVDVFTSHSEIRNGVSGIGSKMTTKQNLSNIGEIGMGVDFSNNELAVELQNQFPLVDWLMNTTQSTKINQAFRNGSIEIRRDEEDGKLYFSHPWLVGTTLPTDTNGECCWTALDLSKAGSKTDFHLLCLKDCEKVLENLVWSKKRFGNNDLTNYFQRQGETVKEARVRMAKLSMAFFTAYNIVNGVSTAGTNVLKPFHGLLEVMESNDVVHMSGENILTAFAQLKCRYAVADVTGRNIVFALHPLTYVAIESVVKPSQLDGSYPDGWSKGADGKLRFMGFSFLEDKTVPVDVNNGTGEIWALDGSSLGVLLGTTLMPTDKDFIRETFAPTDNPEDGCATECTFYYNFGGVFNTNPYRMAVITSVPLSANCLGSTLDGLDNVIKPQTLVPLEVA